MKKSYNYLLFIFFLGIAVGLVSCKELILIDYTNESAGFSLQYPSEYWEIILEENSQIVLERSSKGAKDAIIVISVFSTEQLDSNSPKEYLTARVEGNQSACEEKEIKEIKHSRYEALETCIDFIHQTNLTDPFEYPSEFTMLTSESKVAFVLYTHYEKSAEIHRDEVGNIISTIILQEN